MWTQKEQALLLHEIEEKADAAYRAFHAGLVPEIGIFYGVRMPVLRRLAKDIADKEGFIRYQFAQSSICYEIKILMGLCLGTISSETTLFSLLQDFLPLLDSWATVDLTTSAIKPKKAEREGYFRFLQQCLSHENPFAVRFGYVAMIPFVKEGYLQQIFSACDLLQDDALYYVKMGVSWLLSVALVYAYDATVAYLKSCRLDDFTYNKALQKGRESLRLNSSQKEELQSLKR